MGVHMPPADADGRNGGGRRAESRWAFLPDGSESRRLGAFRLTFTTAVPLRVSRLPARPRRHERFLHSGISDGNHDSVGALVARGGSPLPFSGGRPPSPPRAAGLPSPQNVAPPAGTRSGWSRIQGPSHPVKVQRLESASIRLPSQVPLSWTSERLPRA